MSTEYKLFECLTLNPKSKNIPFVDMVKEPYRYRDGEINYKLSSFEIKSQFPPTDCVLTLEFSGSGEQRLNDKELHFINYRKNFIYENGYYILYIDDVDELSKLFTDIRPRNCSFDNNRDENSECKIYFTTIFTGRSM
jgi:hypothetical protein